MGLRKLVFDALEQERNQHLRAYLQSAANITKILGQEGEGMRTTVQRLQIATDLAREALIMCSEACAAEALDSFLRNDRPEDGGGVS